MGKIQYINKFAKIDAVGTAQTNTIKAQVVKGHINKLLFVFPQGAKNYNSVLDSFLTVKYVGKRVKNLITKLQFDSFYDISNEQFGGVIGLPIDLASLSKLYNADGDDTVLKNALNDKLINEKIAVFVDLGSFTMDSGDELHIEFERNSRADFDIPELHVFQVSDEPYDAFNMISYDVEEDLNEVHQNVRKLYLKDKDAWKTNRQFDIYVDSESSQYQVNNVGAIGYAMLKGEFENQNPDIFSIYDNEIPEDVAVKIVGVETGSIQIISMRVDSNFIDYERQQREVLLKSSKVVENLEKNQPDTASVMQASGIIPSSVELMNKADEFKS